jgi:hypothetical protein
MPIVKMVKQKMDINVVGLRARCNDLNGNVDSLSDNTGIKKYMFTRHRLIAYLYITLINT